MSKYINVGRIGHVSHPYNVVGVYVRMNLYLDGIFKSFENPLERSKGFSLNEENSKFIGKITIKR